MADQRSRDQPENCKSAGSKVSTDAACKPKARLRRHRSLEDIPSTLKTTQEQHVLSIFVQYCARNRTAVSNSSATALPVRQPHTDSTSCSYRRLKSEPNSSVSCTIDETPQNSKREEHSQATPSRPCTLTLGVKHQRMPSSDSSGKATPAPAPDPPLFSPEALQPYPLASQRSRSASSPLPPSAHVETGEVQSQSHLCAAQCEVLLPALINRFSMDAERQVYSRMIADRIRSIGDSYARKYGEEQLERRLTSLILSQNPANMNLTSVLSVLRGSLSWQKVSEIFWVGYNLLEMLTAEFGPHVHKLPQEDKRWALFQKLWDVMMSTVAPWIWEHGGRLESLHAMEGMEGVYTTTPASFAAVHQCPMEPLSSPALQRDRRLYSLTESGIFVDEDGNTMDEIRPEQEAVRLDQREEEEEERYHQASTGLQRGPLTLESDSPFSCPMDNVVHSSGLPLHMLASTPGASSTHSQEDGELLDSGIVSSTEQLSLESHDTDSFIGDNTLAPMVTMATSNGCQTTPFQRKCSSMRVKGSQSSKDGQVFEWNRSKSLPGSKKGRGRGTRRTVNSAPTRREKPEKAQRRTSETALTGLFYTVNISVSAAFAYAAVSSFFN